MAEVHARYGQQRASQISTQAETQDFETAFAAALLQSLDSNNVNAESNDASQALESECSSNIEFSLDLPAWPETSMASTDARTPWQSSSPPAELHELPSDETLPAEIMNIVRWSLIRPVTRQPNTRRRCWRQDAPSSSRLPAEEFAYLKTAITDVDNDERDNPGHEVNPLESKNDLAVANAGSISQGGGREKVHSLRSNLKASIIDFASELRDSLELTKHAKAVLEAKERERTRTVECTSCFVSSSDTLVWGFAHQRLPRTTSSPLIRQHYPVRMHTANRAFRHSSRLPCLMSRAGLQNAV